MLLIKFLIVPNIYIITLAYEDTGIHTTVAINMLSQTLKSCKQYGWNAEIFRAIDGYNLDSNIWNQLNLVMPVRKNNSVGRFADKPGALGCFLSHFLLWNLCIELNQPVIILEDDVDIIDTIDNDIMYTIGTIVIIDHIGLLKTTKDQPNKKEAIDKMSNELQYVRDFFGYTPVIVSQFNRSISNPMRLKAGDVEPQLEDFSDSSSTQNDADVVLALFDPVRYKVEDTSGYDLNKLKDEYGGKYFRSLRLLKNSYGEDDIRIGLGFLGMLGIFKELPRKRDITDADYESIINKSYFLKE
jgi:hypothetical protein